MKPLPLAAAALLALAACDPPSGPAADVRLVVRGTEFQADPATGLAEVPLAVHNRGDEPVMLPRCGARLSVDVESRQGVAWIPADPALCVAIQPMDPLPLPPGQTRDDLRLVAGPGRYRLRIALADGGARTLVSAPFEVR